MILSSTIRFALIFTLVLIFSCQSPTEIDVHREIDIDYKIKKDIELSEDFIDFGFVEKEAFYFDTLKISNSLNRNVIIKSIKLSKELKNEPSYFYFDPLQNLNDINLIPNSIKNFYLSINLFQKNVGEFKDTIIIQTDTTYHIYLKSIVPDIMVKDMNDISTNLNDSNDLEINVSNYSNYVRKIEKITILNDDENIIKFDENNFSGKWISANSSYIFNFKIYGKVKGNFTPQIIFETQNGVISKNTCNLNINVN